MRLGLKPVKYDPRTLRLRSYLPHQEPIPDAFDWTIKPSSFPPLLNDQIGDCAIAGSLHQNKAWVLNDGGIYEPTDAMALADYEHFGFDPKAGPPGNNPTDQGCIMLDVMNYWRRTGIGGKKIGAFAATNPLDDHACCYAIYAFGGLQLGVQLPLALNGQPPGSAWKAPARFMRSGDWRPGSWGGHRIVLLGYNAKTRVYKGVSWGRIIDIDFDFVETYSDPHVGGEAYAALSAAFLNASFVAPNGFGLNQLLQDLGATIAP